MIPRTPRVGKSQFENVRNVTNIIRCKNMGLFSQTDELGRVLVRYGYGGKDREMCAY